MSDAGQDVTISAPRARDLVGHRQRDAPEVDDAGSRAPEPLDARGVRLDLEDALTADVLEARHAVRQRPLAQGGESRQLAVIERHHELAAVVERDVVRLGEGFDIGLALAAESCLERAGRVVQAGVEDAAVVAGLVGRELSFLLDDGDAAGPDGPPAAGTRSRGRRSRRR